MKKYGKVLGFTLLYMALFLVTFFVISLLYSIVYSLVPDSNTVVRGWMYRNSIVTFSILDIACLSLLYLVFKRRQKNIFEVCNFKKINFKTAGLSFLIGLITAVFSFSLARVGFIKQTMPSIETSLLFLVGGDLYIFILMVITNPLCKETLYRGAIMSEIRTVSPLVPALFIQAIVYGLSLLGVDVYVMIYGILGALLFGMVFIAGKSIFASVLAETGCNIGLYIIGRTAAGNFVNQNSSTYLAVGSLIFIGALLLVMRGQKVNHRPEVDTHLGSNQY